MDFIIKGLDPKDRWSWVCAILEKIEEGSSAHCLDIRGGSSFGAIDMAKHHRLGVSIHFLES